MSWFFYLPLIGIGLAYALTYVFFGRNRKEQFEQADKRLDTLFTSLSLESDKYSVQTEEQENNFSRHNPHQEATAEKKTRETTPPDSVFVSPWVSVFKPFSDNVELESLNIVSEPKIQYGHAQGTATSSSVKRAYRSRLPLAAARRSVYGLSQRAPRRRSQSTPRGAILDSGYMYVKQVSNGTITHISKDGEKKPLLKPKVSERYLQLMRQQRKESKKDTTEKGNAPQDNIKQHQ